MNNSPAPTDGPRSAYEHTLRLIGSDIVDGRLATGTVCTVDELVTRTGRSRSVVREATRVLSGLGLLESRAHVGHTVRPPEQWDWLAPTVLRWSLAGARRPATMRAIRELRAATEPESARLAAERRTDEQAERFQEAAETLLLAAARQDVPAFLDADLRLHGLLRLAADNPLLGRVGSAIDEALLDRAGHLADGRVDAHDASLHREVAAAIVAGDGDRAARAMHEIITRTA